MIKIKKKTVLGEDLRRANILLQSSLLENEMVKSLWIKASEQILGRS